MKPMTRTVLLARVLLLLLTVSAMPALDARAIASAQFLLNFGHAGTLRTLKGQVRYSDDTPIPHATLSISEVGNEKDYVIEADEGGNFIKPYLPSGKYKIRVRGEGSNIGEFTVRISQGSPATSSKFMIIKLSPGCASGDASVKLAGKTKKQ